MASASATVGEGSTVRNIHVPETTAKVEAIDREAGRFRLSCDAPGLAKDVGWSAAGLDDHWEHVYDTPRF